MGKMAWRLGLLVAVFFAIPACGRIRSNSPGVGSSPGLKVRPPFHAYLASFDDQTIGRYRVDPTSGLLRPNGNFSTPGKPIALAVAGGGRFLYATLNDVNLLAGYSIQGDTGSLAPLAGSPWSTQQGPTSIVIEPRGTYLFACSTPTDQVVAYAIGPLDGSLTFVGNFTTVSRGAPFGLAASPVAPFLFACNSQAGSVTGFAWDPATGALSVIAGSPFATGALPIGAAIDPAGKFLYVASAGASAISAYGINPATGVLTPLAGSPALTDGPAIGVAVDPSGQLVLVTTSLGVSAYSIAPDGTLSFVSGPFADGKGGVAVTFDTDGRHVYVANQTSADVSTFVLDPSPGSLRVAGRAAGLRNVQSGLVLAPGAPRTPPNCFAYVINNGSNNLSGFSVDPGSGGWTPLLGSPFTIGGGPLDVAVDPSNRFLFVTTAPGSLWVYSIDPATGALSAAPGAPYATGSSPSGISVDPTGRFIHVATSYSRSVLGFSLNPATGALTPLPGSPYSAGSFQPYKLAVNPTGRYLYACCLSVVPGTTLSFGINPSDGSLSPPLSLGQGNSHFDLGVDPWGTHLYVGDPGTQAVYALALDNGSGGLSLLTRFFYAVPGGAYSLAVSPSGGVLYAALSQINSIGAFEINSLSGEIVQPVAGSPFTLADSPISACLGPAGRFVYAVQLNAGLVSGFAVDPSSGALTALAGFPLTVGTMPLSIALTGTQP